MGRITYNAVNVLAMAVLANALRLYARTRMRVNRAYSPTNMMRAAERHLGRTFKRRDYLGAAEALDAKVQIEKERIANAEKRA